MLQQHFSHLDFSFTGWDFSYLTSTQRMDQAPLPWNYYVLASTYIKQSSSLLDLGTGGGEFLSSLPIANKVVYATERYKPNVEVATAKLKPLNVTVFGLEKEERIPLPKESVDLVLSRHEGFNANEVYDLLKDNGVFVTQQVGGNNNKQFYDILGSEPFEYFDYNLEVVVEELKQANFTIVKAEQVVTYTRYYDIESVIYYLMALNYQFSNYSSDVFVEGIKKIEQLIGEQGYFDVNCDRFVVVARK